MVSQAVEVFQYRGLIRNLVAKDLKVRYKNSALGFFWSLLNPLLMMLVFSGAQQLAINMTAGYGVDDTSPSARRAMALFDTVLVTIEREKFAADLTYSRVTTKLLGQDQLE